MSDDILRLIPTDPDYVPDAETQRRACALFASFIPQASEVLIRTSDTIEFVDQGTNFERIVCPLCGVVLDNGWWQNAMDTAYVTGFADLGAPLPCCQKTVSLNDLHYQWPAGFARFVLEAHCPNIADLNYGQINALEEILGCSLRRIWAHY